MKLATKWIIAILWATAILVEFGIDRSYAAGTPSCNINVPAVQAQADGSGTITGHVTGSCTFAWHSVNEIQFKDRWHTLGTERHAGGAAGIYVSQPRDSDDYHGDGYWREIVNVYNAAGAKVFQVIGPVSEFAS